MSSDNWFRNTTWNEGVASQFEAKIRRARRKEQYLRIQACMLAETNPQVAHSLLDRYFALPDDFDHAQAYVDRARAYLSEGKTEEAIASYESALQREAVFPNLRTQAYIELPYLVATLRFTHHYNRALEILDGNKERLMFPIDHFKWNTAMALISNECGEASSVSSYAEAALRAAERDTSGFRYHPTVGLVGYSYLEIQSLLRGLYDA